MGTNYYAHYNICEHCHRRDIIHIGKSSAGWTFTFHATEDIKSYQDWLKFLENERAVIFDEYNENHTLSWFKDLVESKKNNQLNHAKENSDGGSYLDHDGNSMSPYEFS